MNGSLTGGRVENIAVDPSIRNDVIDLTILDTNDEEDNGGVIPLRVTSNTRRMTKFTFTKVTRSSRLQIVREGMSEKIRYSLFSEVSKEHWKELEALQKRTYTGESRNPFFGNALFAAEVIEPGEFICLYYGRRMPWCEAEAVMGAGRSSDYMIYVTEGVVIDGFGVGVGAAMANNSCVPNAELQHDYLRGYERAPYGLLRAVEKINIGDEIEAKYGFWDPLHDPIPNLTDTDSYVPCRCLRMNCCRVLRLKQ